jgi:hypothetical protein
MADVLPVEVEQNLEIWLEWVRIWHGGCKAKSCDVKYALDCYDAGKEPVLFVYSAVLDVDDDQESWGNFLKIRLDTKKQFGSSAK